MIGLDASDAVEISAKTGLNIEAVLEALVTRLPPPKGDEAAPLKALLVDSWYDAYLGVVILVRIKDGALKAGMKIRMMATGASHQVERVGVFTPKQQILDRLGPGEIGFITAGIKTVADCRIGDTITEERRPADRAAARLQAVAARGVLRPVSDGCGAVRASARIARQAAPQRRQLRIRARDLGGAGLRFPLRLSWACCISKSSRSGWSANSIST